MSMLHQIKRVFRKLTPVEMASTELTEAELAKLEAHTAQEYASSMVEYQNRRIARLKAFLASQTKEIPA